MIPWVAIELAADRGEQSSLMRPDVGFHPSRMRVRSVRRDCLHRRRRDGIGDREDRRAGPQS